MSSRVVKRATKVATAPISIELHLCIALSPKCHILTSLPSLRLKQRYNKWTFSTFIPFPKSPQCLHCTQYFLSMQMIRMFSHEQYSMHWFAEIPSTKCLQERAQRAFYVMGWSIVCISVHTVNPVCTWICKFSCTLICTFSSTAI